MTLIDAQQNSSALSSRDATNALYIVKHSIVRLRKKTNYLRYLTINKRNAFSKLILLDNSKRLSVNREAAAATSASSSATDEETNNR
jgi:hypothetical protein